MSSSVRLMVKDVEPLWPHTLVIGAVGAFPFTAQMPVGWLRRRIALSTSRSIWSERISSTRFRGWPFLELAARPGLFRRAVNPSGQKYSALPKFGNGVCIAHPARPGGAIVRRH
ncbi:hypothetical protein [Bradyrhizobium monzae]|uniref:hypothetical protein n=1 Tax=Bradyrhizobium sp. Oc8 TaxID=2876780 RepID=UPI001F254D79|nr:hypothetical protein [Bradyrhizobium sp. Oc8]